MQRDIDFSKVTYCGGDCSECKHYIEKACEGCVKTGGECVKMWQNRCEIAKCCIENGVRFCGLCERFPCEWLKNKITQWDASGIEKLQVLAEAYRKIMITKKAE